MTNALRPWAAQLLYFWFHELTPRDWYRGGKAVDTLIEARFARYWHALHQQPVESFLGSPRDALGAVRIASLCGRGRRLRVYIAACHNAQTCLLLGTSRPKQHKTKFIS